MVFHIRGIFFCCLFLRAESLMCHVVLQQNGDSRFCWAGYCDSWPCRNFLWTDHWWYGWSWPGWCQWFLQAQNEYSWLSAGASFHQRWRTDLQRSRKKLSIDPSPKRKSDFRLPFDIEKSFCSGTPAACPEKGCFPATAYDKLQCQIYRANSLYMPGSKHQFPVKENRSFPPKSNRD